MVTLPRHVPVRNDGGPDGVIGAGPLSQAVSDTVVMTSTQRDRVLLIRRPPQQQAYHHGDAIPAESDRSDRHIRGQPPNP
jgi:hypothetical protein